MNRYAELVFSISLNRISRHFKSNITGSFNIGAVACDQQITLFIISTGFTNNIYKFLIDLVHCLILLINGQYTCFIAGVTFNPVIVQTISKLFVGRLEDQTV